MCKDLMVELKSKDIPTNPDILANKLKEIHGVLKRNREETI